MKTVVALEVFQSMCYPKLKTNLITAKTLHPKVSLGTVKPRF